MMRSTLNHSVPGISLPSHRGIIYNNSDRNQWYLEKHNCHEAQRYGFLVFLLSLNTSNPPPVLPPCVGNLDAHANRCPLGPSPHCLHPDRPYGLNDFSLVMPRVCLDWIPFTVLYPLPVRASLQVYNGLTMEWTPQDSIARRIIKSELGFMPGKSARSR